MVMNMCINQLTGRGIPVAILFLSLMLLSITEVSGQSILKRVKNKVEQTVGDKVVDKADKAVAKGVDKVMGVEAEEGSQSPNPASEIESESAVTPSSLLKAYSKYDFIPGDSEIGRASCRERVEI